MFRKFFPDVYMESTYKIDFQKLYEKGYRGVIFDIDNTLVPHGEPADKRAIALFENLNPITSMKESTLLMNKYRYSLLKMRISLPERIIKRQWSLWERL